MFARFFEFLRRLPPRPALAAAFGLGLLSALALAALPALAMSAGALPQVGPPATDAEAVWMRTGAPAPLPRSETVTRSDGSVGTALLTPWRLNGSHLPEYGCDTCCHRAA